MKTRIVIATSFITTIIVLVIATTIFTLVSPTMAQALPASRQAGQAPSLADAHLALPEGGGGKTWNILGSDLTDLYSAEDHGSAFGCIYYNSVYPYTRANATIHLPDGATIHSIRFYWKDGFVQDSELRLLRYYHDPYANYEILTTLWSSGTVEDPLESYTEDTSLDILVDNSAYIYAVYVDIHFNEDDMRICGIEIGYTPPSVFGYALPLVKTQ
jgi:hypothetical protein